MITKIRLITLFYLALLCFPFPQTGAMQTLYSKNRST